MTAEFTTKEILAALQWGEWKQVATKHGERKVRTATPSEDFWKMWREDGATLKANGFSVSKYEGEWLVSEWVKLDGEISGMQTSIEQPAPTSVAIPEVEIPDDVKAKLLSFQIPSVKILVNALSKHGSALDGSDLGSGKTFVSIAACKILGKKLAVICPKAVIPSWYRACEHFGIKPEVVINYELVRNGKTSWGHWQSVGKVEKFVWSLPVDTMFVFDEIHKAKSAKSVNCKIATAALEQGYMVEGISGTAACNPTEMKIVGQLTKLHKGGGDFYRWQKMNGVIKGRFGFFFNGSAQVLARINKQIYPEHGTRLKIADIPEFPETQIAAEAYDCGENTGKIDDVYKKMFEELADLDTKEFESAGARKGAELAIQMFARQRAELLKIPAAVEMIEDYIEAGQSVVIFTNFRDTIEALSKRLETKCIVQGDQSADERQRNVDSFQMDKERVILVNIQSGGAGLSLHDINGNHPRAAIIFPTWSAIDFKQSTGRVHRAGGKSKSIQRVVFAAGTIEDEICQKLKSKLQNIAALNDADLAPNGIFK